MAHPQLEHEAKIYAKLEGGGNSFFFWSMELNKHGKCSFDTSLKCIVSSRGHQKGERTESGALTLMPCRGGSHYHIHCALCPCFFFFCLFLWVMHWPFIHPCRRLLLFFSRSVPHLVVHALTLTSNASFLFLSITFNMTFSWHCARPLVWKRGHVQCNGRRSFGTQPKAGST